MSRFPFAKTPDTDWSESVRIKRSQLPKAGKGLFSLRTFTRGDIICEYEGEVVPWSECERRSDDGHEGYAVFITKNRCIDAFFTPWAAGRYANDARGIGRVSGLRNNAHYEIQSRKGEKRVFIVATRTIRSGEEVFVHYGDDYWRYLGHTRELFLRLEREKRKRYNDRKSKRN
jgi:hypothetical protein